MKSTVFGGVAGAAVLLAGCGRPDGASTVPSDSSSPAGAVPCPDQIVLRAPGGSERAARKKPVPARSVL